MIRGVHHTSFSTKNFDAMIRFYRDLLGFEHAHSIIWDKGTEPADAVVGLKDSAVNHALLKAGNAFIEIFEYRHPVGADPHPNRPANDATIQHICLDVVDIEAEYERMLAAGVRFHTPPVVFRDVKCTYGRDPDGNVFEIQEVIDLASPIHMDRLGPGVVKSLKAAAPEKGKAAPRRKALPKRRRG